MKALGRILQVIGWLWFIAGLVGPAFGLNRVNFLPGLILIFVARVIRAQRGRETSGEAPATQPAETETSAPPERILNTERRQPSPGPARTPPAPTYTRPEPEPQTTPEQRGDLLERITGAGREEAVDPEPAEMPEVRRPMSSDEMIARAHRRWDSKRG